MSAAAVFAGLADGAGHDPAKLAARAGLDSGGLDAALAALSETGLEIERTPQAVRLATRIDWLDAGRIAAALPPAVARRSQIDVLLAAGSSNDELLRRPPPAAGELEVCIVEFQHGGRGRRGRKWTAPPGGTLCLSAAWYFAGTPQPLSTLSLIVGVAALRALARAAGVAAGVKWPNDLVYDGRKLGGILVEARNDAAGTHIVAGIGINVRVPPPQLATISDWPRGAVDLASATAEVPSRDALAAALIDALADAFREFATAGFRPFADEWNEAHILRDAAAVLSDGKAVEEGVVRGIDADGALLFEQAGAIRRVLAGDVSLRGIT